MDNFFEKISSCYVIAEIGVNHNGDMSLAKEMISAAKECGADAVKFQTFKASSLVSKGTPKVLYQNDTTSPNESHYDMIEKLELPEEAHYLLFDYCKSQGVDFLSTPYDLKSAEFLSELGVNFFKTASADIVDLPLQQYLASTGKPVIVATGMATLGEIEDVVNIYKAAKNLNLILLHCVSNYPCSYNSINLRSMTTIRNAFNIPIGYSDHSEGFLASVMAVSIGAKVIEKHFTLNKNLPGPDHKASSTPKEFEELVKNVRLAECILGSANKSCQPEEYQMSQVSRKSLFLAKSVSKGELLSSEDLVLMRPGTGILARDMPLLVNKTYSRDFESGHQLRWSDFID